MANLAQFIGQSTANVVARNLGSYAWPLWISSAISLFSLVAALAVFFLDRFLRATYAVDAGEEGKRVPPRTGTFALAAVRELPTTFWLVVLFAVFENAGVQSFVSISTCVALLLLERIRGTDPPTASSSLS